MPKIDVFLDFIVLEGLLPLSFYVQKVANFQLDPLYLRCAKRATIKTKLEMTLVKSALVEVIVTGIRLYPIAVLLDIIAPQKPLSMLAQLERTVLFKGFLHPASAYNVMLDITAPPQDRLG